MPSIDTRRAELVLGHGGCGCRSAIHEPTPQPAAFGGPGAEPQYPPSLEIEPLHLNIGLRLDLTRERLEGRVVHTVVGRGAGARTLALDAVAFQGVAVRDVSGKGLVHAYDGRKLVVTWDLGFAVGERRDVEITYVIERPVSGLFFMQPSAEYPNKPLYAATDHETERARFWLPCVDLPNVRTTLEFHITADAKLTILANGALQGEAASKDGTKTAHWRLDQRCPSYLVCFAVGDFERFDDGDFEGIPLAYFACRDFSKADLKRSFGRTREMLQWMTKRLGVRFPFPKYFQFALPDFGGAMENISLVSWDDHFVLTERMAPEGTWLTDQVNVHEMAHSYFGDLVVIRDFAHAWLKESWATYMETCWLEDKRGQDEQFYDLYRNAQAYFQEADEVYARPLVTRQFTSSWQMYDRHLYPGGACRLHTLRKEIGDEAFWRAVSEYLSTFREQVVETDDFRRMLEKHSGRSLQKLFDQWVMSASYPAIKVAFTYDKERQVGTFEIEQKQADEKRGVAAFELSTDVSWVINGKQESQAIRLTKGRHSFNFRMDKDPEQVRFDPFWKVLHKLEFNPGDDKLKAQMRGAKDVVGRIHAALALAETGKRANILEVLDAWRTEPFWGVKREMIRALERAETGDAVAALCIIIADEKDPLVLDRVMDAAAEFRDEAVAQAVEARLAKGDLGPVAASHAYLALGAQRERAPLKILKDAAGKSEAQYGYEQASALAALGMSRDAATAGYLRKQAAYGVLPFRARRGVVNGLAAAVLGLEQKDRLPAEEALTDFLRDPEAPLRMLAARALRLARVRGAVPALEAFRRTLPLQEQVIVDASIAGLLRGEDAKTAALEKQVEEMQARYRKLHDRLQDLEDKMK